MGKELLKALTKMGVEPIEALGETFDPNLHNAIQQVGVLYPTSCPAVVQATVVFHMPLFVLSLSLPPLPISPPSRLYPLPPPLCLSLPPHLSHARSSSLTHTHPRPGTPQVESTEYAEGVVSQSLQRGYKIGERVVRAAMCVVSSGPGPEAGTPPADATESETSDTSEATSEETSK